MTLLNPMPPMDPLDITLDSDLSRVRELGSALNAGCRQLGFSPEESAEIELAVCEAVNNAIIHAYHRQPGNPVRVTARPVAGQLLIEVTDQGTPPPTGLPEPPPDQAPASLTEGGRGLAIIRAVMNEVDYRSSTVGNILAMRRPLPQR